MDKNVTGIRGRKLAAYQTITACIMLLFLTNCAGINYMKTYNGETLQEKTSLSW